MRFGVVAWHALRGRFVPAGCRFVVFCDLPSPVSLFLG